MINGMARFDFFMKQLQEHLTKASQEANPAEWLYANGSRTPLFMLEALAKLYSNLHNKPMFTKIKARFKQLEDVLGDIDHYDCYVKEFSKKEDIPGFVISFLESRKLENLKLLNDVLIEKNWIGKKANRLEKIRKKIKGADWMKEKQEINAIKTFYQNAIVEINVFYRSAGGQFSDLENQVHALRRKLRWLSIFPQALRGCIQLTNSKPMDEKLTKYLIPEIINSPFNKMPDPGDNRYLLLLEKNYFLALSWMIAESGKLKDAGLGIIALEEALAYKDHLPGNIETVHKVAASGETLEAVLLKATHIFKDYFDEQNLEKLVVGVSSDQLVG